MSSGNVRSWRASAHSFCRSCGLQRKSQISSPIFYFPTKCSMKNKKFCNSLKNGKITIVIEYFSKRMSKFQGKRQMIHLFLKMQLLTAQRTATNVTNNWKQWLIAGIFRLKLKLDVLSNSNCTLKWVISMTNVSSTVLLRMLIWFDLFNSEQYRGILRSWWLITFVHVSCQAQWMR